MADAPLDQVEAFKAYILARYPLSAPALLWSIELKDARIAQLEAAQPQPPAAPPNLLQRCQEVLAWHKTGKLEGDALRQFAASLECPDYLRLRLAETQTADEAFAFVVAHGITTHKDAP